MKSIVINNNCSIFDKKIVVGDNTNNGDRMFDLNRDLIAEQKGVTMLTQKSLEGLINTIKEKKYGGSFIPSLQVDLFA